MMLCGIADHLGKQMQCSLVVRIALEVTDEAGRTETAGSIRILRQPLANDVPVAWHPPMSREHLQGHCVELVIATPQERLDDRERLMEVVTPKLVNDVVGFVGW
jgi:hypothetical protein